MGGFGISRQNGGEIRDGTYGMDGGCHREYKIEGKFGSGLRE